MDLGFIPSPNRFTSTVWCFSCLGVNKRNPEDSALTKLIGTVVGEASWVKSGRVLYEMNSHVWWFLHCKFTQIFTKMDDSLGAITFLWLFCYRSKQTCQKGPSSSPYGSCVGCYPLTILALMLWKWIIEELRGWNVHCFYADSMNRWPHPKW